MNCRKIALFTGLLFMSVTLFAQKGTIKGIITDKSTGESLIGANVTYAPGKGVVTGLDGDYTMELPYGDYTLTISYVGFDPQNKNITINKAVQTINFSLNYTMLSEVEVVGDMAKTRETPVAFSNIESIKMEEELASQDIPLLLNATPGVYATQQGGGDGDSRINIRGFNQRNVAVMLDGIPVNDMENGWVYWSNWFGLDVVMQNTQIQRGLGKSKLAIPSVGGTINLQTKGIGSKPLYTIKQEVGSDLFLRTSVGLTTGRMKNGWGITAAGSYKRGDGWVDQTWTEGWFYFLRIDKELGNHHISFKAMGAPQEHGQRSTKSPLVEIDSTYAFNNGVNRDDIIPGTFVNLGRKYNPDWGWLERYTFNAEGGINSAPREALNSKKNYYHKPMFSLSDFWNVNDNLYISNILYLSVGSGGGTGLKNTPNPTSEGQINLQSAYDANINNPNGNSDVYQYSSINNHFWYGLLSTFSLEINEFWNLSGGLDLRDYRGEHYREVYDLLGGKYMSDDYNSNAPKKEKYYEGDKIYYHNDALVRWGGIFGQLSFKKNDLSAFINITGSYSGNKRIDYFKPKMIELKDTVLRVSYDTEVEYNGVVYNINSPEAVYAHTGWSWFAGGTIKGGVNYNINDNMNIFGNMGYIHKAPRFKNIYDNANTKLLDIKNEEIKAFELGYSYYNSKITFNFNSYYTIWSNKPADRTYTENDPNSDETYTININGMDARHMGLEFEFAYQITDKILFESLLSIGDWKWTSADSARVYNEAQELVGIRYFDAKGIYVGDAAQLQNRESIRIEPIKNTYIKASLTYFGKHYSEFDPLELDPKRNPLSFDENGNPRQSWKIPDYYIIDLHLGYKFNIKKTNFNIRGSVLNLLDEVYVTDADNNGYYYKDFDAKSARAYFGLGRRFNISLQMTF